MSDAIPPQWDPASPWYVRHRVKVWVLGGAFAIWLRVALRRWAKSG